jgi:hypothetical protein
LNSFSFRRFGELVLLLGLGFAAGVAMDRWLRPLPSQAVTFVPVTAPALAPSPPAPEAAAGPLDCSVEASFDNNVYPSLLLSLAAADPEYSRCVTVMVKNAVKGRTYQIAVQSPLLESPSVTTTMATSDHFEVRPALAWNFTALRGVTQLQPANLNATATTDTESATGLATCMIHPVNEAVSRILDPTTNEWVDLSVCFAAYVNEDHPWINQILQEASSRDGVARFSGYELGADSVVRQMRAVWDALAARGLTYVDLATTSSAVSGVSTQYVRFLDQSVRDQGANCVDASVLFASIFRRIGLRPVLIFRPGHCFVAVYDAAQGGQLIAVEPTLLSSAPFGSAFFMGSQELTSTLPHLDTPGFSSVDIAVARQSGIRPIEYLP